MSLRDPMPNAAWLVDVARALCGTTEINEQIRAGMSGAPDFFHAMENGRTIGTPMTLQGGVSVAEMAPFVVPEAEDATPVARGRRGR